MPNAKRDNNRITTLLGASSADGKTPTLVQVINTSLKVSDAATGTDFGNDPVIDGNRIPVLFGVSSVDGKTPITVYADAGGALLVTSPVTANIAFNNAAGGTYQASGTLTSSFTMGTGANGVLFVWNESGGAADPTSITYNGIALTKVIAGATGDGISLWQLIAPPSGAHTISVTSAGQIYYSPLSYTGVSQATPINASTATSGGSTAATATLTPTVSNTWMVSYVQDDATATFATTGSDAQRGTTGAFADMFMVDTNATIASGSVHTQTVTVQSSAWFMVSIILSSS